MKIIDDNLFANAIEIGTLNEGDTFLADYGNLLPAAVNNKQYFQLCIVSKKTDDGFDIYNFHDNSFAHYQADVLVIPVDVTIHYKRK